GHEGRITSISYFLDGQRIISGSVDKTTRQWDLKAGKEIEGAKEVFEKRVCAVAVSRDGRWIVTADGDWNGGRLKACEVETGIVKIFEGHSQYINTVDISTDSTLLASGSQDETSRIWNLKTGKLTIGAPFQGHTGIIWGLALSFDGALLASSSYHDNAINLWAFESRQLLASFHGHEWNIRSISYFPDGQRIISGSFDKTTRQWDLKTG
ncbi:WD40 repeat-like protein, partial [Suillus spraguei]